ncbi:MAG: hypothetical protein ACOCX8_03180 [Bacteroidota bacterium]
MKRTAIYVIGLLLLGWGISSCSTERELANEFLKKRDSLAVLLIPPDFVFKTNLKAYEIENFESLNEWQQDSALFARSKFINRLNDTLLIKRMLNSLEAGLRSYGIQTFTQDRISEFMETEKAAYQVGLAQLEAEEDVYPYRAEEVFFDTVVFYEDFLLDQVSLNSWFEVSKLNEPDGVNHVLYASHYVMDALEGRFVNNVFTNEVKFKYDIDSLKVENVYALAGMLGEKYAGYLFDYLMNGYIYRSFPEGQRPSAYLHFDLSQKLLYPAGDDRFIFLDE